MNIRQSFDEAAEEEKTYDPDRRNRYFRHRHLTAADYRLEQVYGIERRRLLSRTIAGWGVARGFALEVQPTGELKCGSGLALDQHGRELVRRIDAAIGTDELVRLGRDGLPWPVTEAEFGQPQPYLLQVHYGESMQGAVRTGSVCDCGKQEWNHLRETVVFSLRPFPDSWRETAQGPCAMCGCSPTGNGAPDESNRRPHACLCEWTSSPLAIPEDAGEWNGAVCYRLADPVPLAFVTVAFDHCRTPHFGEVDACTPRRILKTNDALYDLIRGCDLTTIVDVSWAGWHDTCVPWGEFEQCFPEDTHNGRRGHRRGGDPQSVGDTAFKLTFSRPVRTDTLGAGSVSIKVLSGEASGGWLHVQHIPVTRLKAPDEDATGLTTSAIIELRSIWCDDEVWGPASLFDEETRVEIEVRGDLILDCNGQAVDATPAGPDRVPSGNGTPGGTYFITFTLEARSDTGAQDTTQ
jgi:hypothetical protein